MEPWPQRVQTALDNPPRVLWHATTPKKVKRYTSTGAILPPVRGFDTEMAARSGARGCGRTVVLRLEVQNAQALPDHHQPSGLAWWTPYPVAQWEEVRQ